MLIRSKHKKKPGTKIRLDLDEYEFKENDAGDQVCEVVYPKHIDIFLNKSADAFEPYGKTAQKELEETILKHAYEMKKAEAAKAEEAAKAAHEEATKARKEAEDKMKADAEKQAHWEAQKSKEAVAVEEAKQRQEALKAEARKGA